MSAYRIAENIGGRKFWRIALLFEIGEYCFGELRYSLKLANNILANCVAPPHKRVGYGRLLCYCSKLVSDILMNAHSHIPVTA